MMKVSGKIVLEANCRLEYWDLTRRSWHELNQSNTYFADINIVDQSQTRISPTNLDIIESCFLQDDGVIFQIPKIDKLRTELVKFLQTVQTYINGQSSQQKHNNVGSFVKPAYQTVILTIQRKIYEYMAGDSRNEIYEDDDGIIYVREMGSDNPYQVFRIDDKEQNAPNINNRVIPEQVKQHLHQKLQRIDANNINESDVKAIRNFIQSPDFVEFIKVGWNFNFQPSNTEDTVILNSDEIIFFRYLLCVYLGIYSCFYDYNFMQNHSTAVDENVTKIMLQSLSDYFGYPLDIDCNISKDQNNSGKDQIITVYTHPQNPISVDIDRKLIQKMLKKKLSLEQTQILDIDKIQNQIAQMCRNRTSLKYYIQQIVQSSIKSLNVLEFTCHFGTFMRLSNNLSTAYYAVIPHKIDHTQNNISGNLYPLTRNIVNSLNIHDLPNSVVDCALPISEFLLGRNEHQVVNYFTNAINTAIFCTVTGQLYLPPASPTINIGW